MHWMTAICFALLISGVEILISHPRFYCGETGNVLIRPLFFTVNAFRSNLCPPRPTRGSCFSS